MIGGRERGSRRNENEKLIIELVLKESNHVLGFKTNLHNFVWNLSNINIQA
jgi:hypothetical protein